MDFPSSKFQPNQPLSRPSSTLNRWTLLPPLCPQQPPTDQSSVRKITKKLKEIDVDEQLRKKRKILHRHTPSPQPSTSSESSCSAPEELEIILRCPNGERLSGKFSNERTPFEILHEAGAIVQYELPLTDANYDVFVNEVPRRRLLPHTSLSAQNIPNRTLIYAEEKD